MFIMMEDIMRLWHQDIIPHLPKNQLTGQHRECCALRGKGWGKKHIVVDYVFSYNKELLLKYHSLIIKRMISMGYKIDPKWITEDYEITGIIYPEHDESYYAENMMNLGKKGIIVPYKVSDENVKQKLLKFERYYMETKNDDLKRYIQKQFFSWVKDYDKDDRRKTDGITGTGTRGRRY